MGSSGQRVSGDYVRSVLGRGAEAELVKHGLGDGVERGEHVTAGAGVGFEAEEGDGAVVEEVFEVFDRSSVRQVALVVLQDDGEAVERAAVHAQVGFEALEGLQVVALAVHLRVGDEDDAISLPQHELERGVVSDLTWDRVEMEGGLVTGQGVGLDGEEIEEQRAILRGGERDEVTAARGVELGVDLLEIGGLAAERRATIDDLEADGVVVVIDAGHGRENDEF